MVYAGFHDARPYIPDPPRAQSAPDPHDEENMDARLDQEEMGQANNKFWTMSRPITPSELRLYRHAQDHRLLSRDILGYPSLFGNMLAQPLISKVIPFSGGLRRSHETCRRREAARRGDE